MKSDLLTALPKKNFVAACALAAIVLLGYYRVFSGGHLYLHEDHLAISNYSYGNALGNGWRPDKGLGVSAFMGDGIWHPWSPLSWWERLVSSRCLAYTSSVILLGFAAAFAQFIFMRRIVPGSHYGVALLLAPLVIFASDQGGFHFLRLSISLLVAMPLFLMLLHDYFQRPSLRYLLGAALIFSFVAAFGNMWSVTGIWALGIFFLISCCVYYRASVWSFVRRSAVLYGVGGSIFVLLSAWFIYSLVYESTVVGYMRDKAEIDWAQFSLAVNLRGTMDFIFGFLFAEWLPVTHDIAGMGYKPFLLSYNVNAAFPLVFIAFVFRKAKDFWEFSLKFLIIVFLVHSFLHRANILGYGTLYAILSGKTSKVFTMYDFIYPLQVGLWALFIARLNDKTVVMSSVGIRRLQRCVAAVLVGFYSMVFLAAAAVKFSPGLVAHFAQWSIQEVVLRLTQKFPQDLLEAVALYNINRFGEVMHWHALLYYLSCIVMTGVFLKDSWLKYVARWPKERISLFLLVSGLLLSWTVYPLSTKKMAWDVGADTFSPTDRFYYVKDSPSRQTLESFKEKYSEIEGGGHRQRQVGLLEPPALNLSGLKSFDTERVGGFIEHAFNGDGNTRLNNRRLYYGGPLYFHDLLNMAAVNYYYSDFKLKDLPPQMSLYFQAKQLYVYKNASAWPYFYLAQKLSVKDPDKHLTDVQRGTAYLEDGDLFELPSGAGKGEVRLKDFSFGDMTFEFNSSKDEFFVIADAWHPLWRAEAQNTELKVLKANEVFKGVRLPAGKYDFRFYFDPSPYKVGVYVSLIGWAVFLALFWRLRSKDILLKI